MGDTDFTRATGALLMSVLAVVPASPPARPSAVERGVVIETVERGSAGERAGLRPGDLILEWSRGSTSAGLPRRGGTVATPFNLTELEDVQAPLGPVTLAVERGGRALSRSLAGGEWGLRTRPSMSARVLARYESGRARTAREDRASEWRAAAEQARASGETAAACWLFTESGYAWAEAARRAEADSDFRQAAQLAGDTRLRIHAHESRGRALYLFVDASDEARRALEEALRLRQELEPDGLSAAAGREALGKQFYYLLDLGNAERHYAGALQIREAMAPGSLVHSRSLRLVGNVHFARGDLQAAEAHYQRSLDLARSWEPAGSTAAFALISLGNVAWGHGRLGEAADLYRQAVALRERADPSGLDVCAGRENLGNVALERGDLAAADDALERAHECHQQANPGRWVTGLRLLGIRGIIAAERGELDAARDLQQRALEIWERLGGKGARFPLVSLGEVALMAGDPASARGYFERAFAIEEKEYPDNLWRAETLGLLGESATRQGDLQAAATYLERALAMNERLMPGSLPTARSLQALGRLAQARAEDGRAAGLYQAALDIRKTLAPGSRVEAESLHSLGLLARRAGRHQEAAGLLRQAVDALENQASRIGGTQEARSSFRARQGEVHRDLLVTLLELGRPEEALHVLERSRARVFLERLAERDLVFTGDVSLALERERQEIHAAHEQTRAKLEGLSPVKERQEVDRLLGVLRDLQRRRGLLADRMRGASPRYAALRYPEPLDAAGVTRALDPGTVLLSYVVGPEKTYLFVVSGQPSTPTVYVLPVGAEMLRQRVATFRRLIRRASSDMAPAVRAEGRALFELLLAPAEASIAPAARVLVCPDGPLHLLPFGALVRGESYFVEWKPLHVVVSATVYTELRRSRPTAPAAAPARLAAFGDPRPDSRHGRDLPVLSATRREIASLQRLFAGRAAVYLGEEATEARARTLGRDVDYVHFACHAKLDERFPLDSALVLSPGPQGENGLLQAWEIFEGVRLDADLVTLSACETALGAEMGGEGLVGLARAFLYAGARSVVASLWSVSDKTTAELMERFYRHLIGGKAKDEALRAAQLEMIRVGGRRSHPFRWAAFQVFGDWR